MSVINKITSEVKKVIVGKDDVVRWVLLAILSGGHILLEDVPGVGKTTLALAFSKTLGLEYGRVQFTPDVLPSDITGYTIYNKDTGKMTYQPGAILCNLFLADELNRATSRTQSALLEAMEEGQVTVDGTSHPVPSPFIVMATQNPTGAAGTQLLPDSQMDRFAVRLSMGYPSAQCEREMIMRRQSGDPLASVSQVVTLPQLEELRGSVSAVYLKESVVDYIIALVNATRTDSRLERGGSPRATLSLTALAKANALMHGRDYVIPDDVGEIFCDGIDHRVLIHSDAQARGITVREITGQILKSVRAPGSGK